MRRPQIVHFMLAALGAALMLDLILWVRGVPWSAETVVRNGQYYLKVANDGLIETDAASVWMDRLRTLLRLLGVAFVIVLAAREHIGIDQGFEARNFPGLREKAKKDAASLLTSARGER